MYARLCHTFSSLYRTWNRPQLALGLPELLLSSRTLPHLSASSRRAGCSCVSSTYRHLAVMSSAPTTNVPTQLIRM